MKQCIKCKKEFPFENFYRQKQIDNSYTYKSKCKSCYKQNEIDRLIASGKRKVKEKKGGE